MNGNWKLFYQHNFLVGKNWEFIFLAKEFPLTLSINVRQVK